MARTHAGSSMADHYRAVARQTGKPPPEPPPMPPAGAHLWDTFLELHRARGGSGFGPSPISHADIEAWVRLKAWPLRPWEVDAIRALDEAYFASQAEKPT